MFQLAISHMNQQNINQWDEWYPDRQILQEDIQKGQLSIGILDSQIVAAYVINSECDDDYITGNWEDKDSLFCVIHRLCIHPLHQNKKIGRNTMLHIEEAARNNNLTSIRLDTFTLNPYAFAL